ncbi:unnamed protein product [Brachionus calyciflorus]|uniref:Uncharacterized protein n=1 Tax=Brachionus calyciflorus TaxID=104777 RepID=A0A814MHH4_9BILA|nr:unnamed protein product [Brachionus calyciflorus]
MKFFLLTFLVVISLSGIDLATWSNTCTINKCELALDSCYFCLGQRQCITCVNSLKPECLKCLEEIFDKKNLNNLNGHQNLICSSNEEINQKACHLHCRGKYQQTGECELKNKQKTCKCKNNNFFTLTKPTESHDSTTTIPTLENTTSDYANKENSTAEILTTTSENIQNFTTKTFNKTSLVTQDENLMFTNINYSTSNETASTTASSLLNSNNCASESCSKSLDICKFCYGERQCRQCITNFDSQCSQCVDFIYDKNNLLSINNDKYLLCDASDPLQTKICNIYCRGQNVGQSSCGLIDNVQVCKCYFP